MKIFSTFMRLNLISILTIQLTVCISVEDSNFVNDCITNKVESLSCEFYSECLEKLHKCGEKGYPINFGGKYCKKTIDNMDKFDHHGQNWIRKSVPCLKNGIKDAISHPNDFNCEIIKVKALRIHPDCYVEAGFCKLLDYHDEQRFCKTVKGLLNIFEIKDFTESVVLEQLGTILQMCRETGEHIDKLKVAYYAASKCGYRELYDKIKGFEL